MLGILDRFAGAAMVAVPRDKKLFAGGWGLPPAALRRHFEESVDPSELDLGQALDLRWEPWRRDGTVALREGFFLSPVPDLPPRLAAGRVLDVRPEACASKERLDRRCLLFGAWSDEGFEKRLRIARRLARQGVSTLIHETPYHGSRRVYGGSPLHTVDEHAHLTRIAVLEGVALLHTLWDSAGEWVVAGFSMGSSHAAAVTCVSGRPVGTALFAVAHSPSIPFVDGVLQHYVAWHALGGRATAEPLLRDVLRRISLFSLPEPARPERVSIVAARADAFVPPWAPAELAERWPGARLHLRRGGHGSLWLFDRGFMARHIVEQFVT